MHDGARAARKRHLEGLLSELGLSLRTDSELCNRYIQHGLDTKRSGIYDVRHVIQRMAESEYLHKYCNFSLGYEWARACLQYRNGQRLPKTEWKRLINRCVLATTISGRFPPVWPWMEGISPEAWRLTNDRSPEFYCYP
jgi:hypothetical protein